MAYLVNPETLISPASVTLGDHLKAQSHVIPEYQRDYEWASDELSQLWDDIVRSVDRTFSAGSTAPRPDAHFLGAVVTQGKPGTGSPIEVIDGQQRLCSLSMLLSVLYEFVDDLPDPMVRVNLTSLLLPLIADLHASGRTPRLRLAREQDFYDRSVVQNLTMDARRAYWATVSFEKAPVRQRIRDAIVFFHGQVGEQLVRAGSAADQRLKELVEGVTELLVVLHLNVIGHGMAYRVFETLNFRGLTLSQADLLKNELVRRGAEQGTQSDVVRDWLTVTQLLDKVSGIDLVEFLQYHYASSFGPVRASDLFETVVELLDSKHLKAQDYTHMLAQEAVRFVALVEGDASVWSADANEALDEIREILGIKYAYPLLMSAAARYSGAPASFNVWAIRVRNFCFRQFTISKVPLGRFSGQITSAARLLRDPANSDASVLGELRGHSSDARYEESFASARVATNKLGFYIVKRIEDYLSAGAGKTFPQSPTQHLEHIMPKKPAAGWGHVATDGRYDSYVPRIGNLLGLEANINQHIKNRDFAYKVSNHAGLDYAHSSFALPHRVSAFLSSGKWDFGSIEARQKQMASAYSNAVWPLT